MGVMVYSLLWVMLDFYHQPYHQHHSEEVLQHAYHKPALLLRWFRSREDAVFKLQNPRGLLGGERKEEMYWRSFKILPV